MKEKFKSVWEKLKTLWGGLTKVVKIVICVALAVVLIGSIVLTVYLNKKSSSDWIVLFPDMTQEESTEVYLELQNKGVETKINSDGEIEVKKSEWDTLVFEMAELGYPQSAPSYGTFFDNLSMTMTEFEKQQTLIFQLQDRLQTTLKRIDGVKGAIVTINVPKESKYAWDEESKEKASASVTLTLSNSAGFTPANVSAVKKLVAYSAQKMEPEDVTVINAQTGQEMLSEEQAEKEKNPEIDMETKMEWASTFKSLYEANAKEILANIYPDGVDAVAIVELDYDKIVEERKELIADENNETVKGHEEIRYETEEGPVDEGGIVGEENNSDIPNYQNGTEPDLNSSNTPFYEHEIDWIDPGYVLTQTEKEQGVVKDASISVVVTNENGYLSRDERNSVIQLVKNATNINEDKISVSARELGKPFDPDPNPNPNPFNIDTKQLLILIGLCGFVLLAVMLIVILMIVKSMKKKMKAQQEESEAAIQTLQETIEENNKKSLAEAAEEHSKTEKAAELEVREFAKNNPEIAAALIRSMLKERDE